MGDSKTPTAEDAQSQTNSEPDNPDIRLCFGPEKLLASMLIIHHLLLYGLFSTAFFNDDRVQGFLLSPK